MIGSVAVSDRFSSWLRCGSAINQDALQPYLETDRHQQALEKALAPIRAFMIKQTREKDLALLVDISKTARPKNIAEVGTTVLVPAFILSELKTAFQIAFMLYVPFLIIDMVVASVLLSMGMMMLPPIMISLPFKLMLFVLADGWYLIVGSLVKSFGVAKRLKRKEVEDSRCALWPHEDSVER
ncbi:MAG: flagellar type III secretion system pore protein FliP [Deltaproteobacteria bacterium]|nr:flagellar type III secretion system pore protein FliP [Deltaproteobacteria bacterium]